MKRKILLLLALIFSVCAFADRNPMLYIKGGKFQMGGFSYDEVPVHTVEVSSFYMSKYKCTMSEWLSLFEGWLPDSNYYSYIGYNIDDIGNKKYGDFSDFNLLGCTWYNAIIYCNRRSVMEGLTPCYASNGSKDAVTYSKILKGTIYYDEVGESLPNITCDWEADGYRLPTEAEWEYAACGGIKGSEQIYAKDYLKHSSTTNNAFGLYDMLHSNAAEWCWDYYGETYYKESINAKDPKGPKTGKYRCNRGGSAKGTDITTRISSEPTQKGAGVGYSFRVVRKAK